MTAVGGASEPAEGRCPGLRWARGQDQGRFVDEGAGDGDPLSLSAVELVGQVADPAREPDPTQCLVASGRRRLTPGIEQPEGHVLGRADRAGRTVMPVLGLLNGVAFG